MYETIYIKYFDKQMPRLEFREKSDWIDLRSIQDIDYKLGEHFLIPLGIAVRLPQGYEVHIAPRSSTYKHFGILQTNSPGIVDQSYCGDNDQWFMPVVALRDGEISKYDRVCQFRIMPTMSSQILNPYLYLTEVDMLQGENRGGYGSTGKS